MKNLYRVKTKQFKTFYVFAKNFDEAIHKVNESILNDNSSVLTSDGSLKNSFDLDGAIEVEILSDKVIS